MGAEGCAEIEKSWAYLTSQEEIECLKSLYKRDYVSAYAKPLEQMGDTVKWQIGAYQIQLGMYKDQKTALEEMQKQINVLQDQTWYEGEGKVYANQENIIWISDILAYQNSIYQSNLTAYEKAGITVTDEYRQICKSTQKVSDMWQVLRNMNTYSPKMPKEVMAMMSNVTTRRCSLYISNLRMNEEKTGYIFDIGLINNETGEVVSDYSEIGELEEVKETIDVQETVSQIPAPTWNERVEAFSDSTLGNIAAALCILPFAGNKALVDTLIRDMSLQESLTESMEFGKGYNQAGLKAAGNTVIGMVTAPDSIAMMLGTMLEKGAINTIETMYSDLKTSVEENLIHGDARSRGEIFANIAMCIAEVVLGAYSSRIGKAFTIGDMTDDVVDEAMKASKLDEVIEGGTKTFHNVSELSNEQIEALIKYTGDDYVNINNSLRGMDTLTLENQAIVEAMKSALENSALPQDMTLYRGTSTEALGSLQNLSVDELVGKTFTEQGFMSTSTSKAIAEGFSGNMKITIEASKGAQALDISTVSQYTTEAEVLFNAGQEMLIISAEVSDGILNITVIIE